MILNKQLLLAIFVLLVAGCASQPQIKPVVPPIQAPVNTIAHQQHLATLANLKKYALKGRLGVVTAKQGFSGGIEWQHQSSNNQANNNQASVDNIDVYSPVGGKIANINKNANEVTMTDQKGNSTRANDAESLTENMLGFQLPLSGLSDWAIGRPTASNIEAAKWDEQGYLTSLKQDGWDISYENYSENNGYNLPNKVILKSEKVNLKLIIEKWTIN